MKKNNKITLLIMLLFAASFLVQSCGKDSKVSYPSSTVSGRILYNGQPVGLLFTSPDINSTNNLNNPLFLTQTGPGKFSGGDIKVYAKHDGSYTITSFDGEYTMRGASLRSPFVDIPLVAFTLKGNYKLDFNVTPYFWISNFQTSFNNNVFTATFKLDKLVSTYNSAAGLPTPVTLGSVKVYFNTTSHPDVNANVTSRTFTTVAQGINVGGICTVTVDLNTFTAAEKAGLAASTGNIFASVAVATSGIQDALYTDAVQLK